MMRKIRICHCQRQHYNSLDKHSHTIGVMFRRTSIFHCLYTKRWHTHIILHTDIIEKIFNFWFLNIRSCLIILTKSLESHPLKSDNKVDFPQPIIIHWFIFLFCFKYNVFFSRTRNKHSPTLPRIPTTRKFVDSFNTFIAFDLWNWNCSSNNTISFTMREKITKKIIGKQKTY